MFRGSATLNLDNKGRLAMPARHRDALLVRCEGRLVVTADPTRCLLVYPFPDWEPIEKKLNGLSSFNPQTRALQRLLVGMASDTEMDGAGRILLPANLREFAGLEKNVVLVGQGVRFELWDEAQWKRQMDEATAFQAGGLPPELEGFSL
jgi:MraZ protein